MVNTFKMLFDTIPNNIHKLGYYSPLLKYKVIHNGHANKVLKELLMDLNINPISVHGLQHTHASVLLYKSVSVYYISRYLG